MAIWPRFPSCACWVGVRGGHSVDLGASLTNLCRNVALKLVRIEPVRGERCGARGVERGVRQVCMRQDDAVPPPSTSPESSIDLPQLAQLGWDSACKVIVAHFELVQVSELAALPGHRAGHLVAVKKETRQLREKSDLLRMEK